MAQVKWTNTAGGDFATGTNWSTGTVPGSGDDAIFMLAGSYTVTSNQNETVNSVQMVQGVTLAIGNNSNFDAINGSGSGTDAGVISVGNDSYFMVGGTIAGTGTVQLNSTGNGTRFQLEANTTLSGGGKLVMSDNSQNSVISDGGPYLLTNVNDTISGAGQFLINNTSFSNGASGVVNANAATNALLVNAGTGTISNAGLMEATGNGGLDIQNSSITQTGTGTIKAVGAGHNVSLDGGSITGGTLTTTGGGMIQSVSNGYLTNVTITAGSTIAALNDEYLHVSGTITNKGTIALNSAGNGTRLQVDSGTLTLTGAGAVILTDSSQNYIYAGTSADLLVNLNNTISGAGELAYNYLAFDNRAAGVIDATGTANALVVDTGGSAFSNEGLMEDTGAGGLAITDGTVIANSGTILAAGAGSHVDLSTGSIQGGTLKTSGGGVIQSVSNFELDGSTKLGAITIAANSQIAVLNDEYLTLAGTIVNAGTISLDAAGNGTEMRISGAVTLTGGGAVSLSDSSTNYFYSINQTDSLVNVNNIITGSGSLTYNYLALDNQAAGIIDSTGTTGMVIDNPNTNAITNEGLIEDTGTGGLTLVGGATIINTGTILATGAGATVDLSSGSIEGGTVSTSNGGVIQITNSGGLYGAGNGALTITTASQVAVLNDEYLYVDGTIINHGTISLDGNGNSTEMRVSGTVTLTGGGAISLSDSTTNYLYSQNQGDVLINVNNTITGSGSLTYNYLTLDNQVAGVINSTGTAGMVFDNPNANSITNEGLIEDTGTGGVTLVGGATIINTGTIMATGTGATVDLYSGAIEGGTVSTSNGGVIQITNSGGLYGAGNGALTITAASQVAVLNDDYLYLDGSIINHGTISLDGSGNSTEMRVNGTVTLTGGGAISLSDSTTNYLYSLNQGDVLINVNNTITGSGSLTYNYLTLDNQVAGVIDSTGTAGMVFDNPDANTVTNEGLIEDTGTGGVSLVNGVTVVNTGTILATGAGATVDLYSGAIEGGTVSTSNGGVIQITNSGGLYGQGNGALTLAAGSQVAVLNDETLFLDGTIINHGTISLDGGGNATEMRINGTVTLTGGGAVTLSDSTNNYIYSVNQTDTLVNVNNVITGAGQLAYNNLTLDNQAAGTIDATGANQLIINSGGKMFTNEGLTEGSGAGGLFIQATTVTNTGTFAALSDSTFTLNSDAPLTNFATGTLTGGTYEAISAGGTHTATVALNSIGAVTVDAATIILSGVGASITAGGTAVESSITSITKTGALELLNGRNVTETNSLTVAGLLLVSKGKFTDTGSKLTNTGTIEAQSGGIISVGKGVNVTNLASGTLTGGTWESVGSGSTIALASGLVNQDAATIVLSGAGSVFQSGPAAASLESTLTTVTSVGKLSILANRGFASTVAGFSDAGSVVLQGGTFSASGLTVTGTGTFAGTGVLAAATTDNGTLTTGGPSTGTLTLTKAVSGSGLLAVTTGDTLDATAAGYSVGTVSIAAGSTLLGAGSATGAITDAGTLVLSGGTLSGGSISVSGLLSGFGTVQQQVSSTGTIEGTGGTLTLANGESGGVLVVDASAAIVADGAVAAHGLTLGNSFSLFEGFGSIDGTITNAGTIDAAGGTLTLASAESGGVLQVENASSLIASAGVTAAVLTIEAGGTFSGSGSVLTTSDAGSLVASGAFSAGTLTGGGSATIGAGGTLSVANPLTIGGGVTFTAGGTDLLALAGATGNTATISGFGANDTIDVKSAVFNKVSYKKGVLTLKEGTTVVGTLMVAGSYTAKNFTLHSDGNGGTDISFKATKAHLSPMDDLRQAAATADAAPAVVASSQAAAAPTAEHGAWMSLDAMVPQAMGGFVLPHLA